MNPIRVLKNPVKSVSLEITTSCALNCVYCEHKIHNKSITYHDFLKVKEKIDALNEVKRITFCGIGEAFLHKDFYRMVEALSNYKITVITSGTILIDYDSLMKNRNVDVIIFSIDAVSREKVMQICGENYSYDNLLLNLKNLKNYNRISLKRREYISSIINCTVNESNITEIVDMVDFAYHNKFSCIHYSLPWGSFRLVKDNYVLLKSQFAAAKQRAERFGVYMEEPFHSFCCIAYDHIMPYIDVNYNFYYCGYGLNQKEAIGNLKESSISELMQHPVFHEYRSGKRCDACDMVEFCSLDKR